MTADTLAHHAARVMVPDYDREALTPSVVHISVGCFHRAHQAVYFDDLARRGETGWGIVGVGLRSAKLGAVLEAQDRLYTVVERGAGPDRARVIGALTRYHFAPARPSAVIDTLADPRTQLLTMTITGAGYYVDPATGAFDAAAPEIQGDLVAPHRPRTAVGFVVEAMRRRRAAGLEPFTVLSCDNVLDNGSLARTAIVGFARERDPGLAEWIDARGAFPSSMVDRIAPQTTLEDRERLAREFGVCDGWPVITEPFSQWVVEDAFGPGQRPPLDLVGVDFVADVRPYSLHKTRLLNASHCALGYLGTLAGLEHMDEAMDDPVLAEYAERFMAEDVAPLLAPIPGFDSEAYQATLLERFANPKLADQLERLCRSGSVKVPRHLLSSIADARAAGRRHDLLTLAVAAWMRYLRGTDEHGAELVVDDPQASRLQALALEGGTDPRPLLSARRVFGDLGDDGRFALALESALRRIERRGVRGAIAATLGVEDPIAA